MNEIILMTLLVMSLSSRVWAADSLFKGYRLFAVTPQSQTQKTIDATILSLYDSPLKESLCAVYPDATRVMYGLGVLPETAISIASKCPAGQGQFRQAEIFQKRYFIALDPEKKSPVQSWTTTDNKTLLFIDKQLSQQELRKILIHEIAIGLDAKMNMGLSNYFVYEGLNTTIFGGRAVVTVDFEANKELGHAFTAAAYPPISMTFATMRAMNVEKIYQDQELPTENHLKCITQFYGLFSYFEKHQEDFKEEESLQSQVVNAITAHVKPVNVDETVKALLSRRFTLDKSKGATFCQYMARPLLSTKSLWSFYANGPRPRIGDGWSEAKDSRGQSSLSNMITGELNNQSLPEVSEDILKPHF